jgi:hypothetical protein
MNPPPGLFDAVPADQRATVWEDWSSAIDVARDLLRERTAPDPAEYVRYIDFVPYLDALFATIATAGTQNVDRYIDEFLTAFGFPEERSTRVGAVRAARRWKGTLLSLAAASESLSPPKPASSNWSSCPLDGTFWLTHGNWPAFRPG